MPLTTGGERDEHRDTEAIEPIDSQAINCKRQNRKDSTVMFTFHVKLKEVICKVIAEQPDDKTMCAVLQSQGIREAHHAKACISRTASSCQSA